MSNNAYILNGKVRNRCAELLQRVFTLKCFLTSASLALAPHRHVHGKGFSFESLCTQWRSGLRPHVSTPQIL